MRIKGGRDGSVHVSLEEPEADLLRGLVAEMRTLLEAGVPANDEVMKRLFPQTFEAETDERAYRELMGDQLEQAKLDALNDVAGSLGEGGKVRARLGPDQIGGWLRLLTDLRLAIGTRLGVTEDVMNDEADAAGPEATAMSVLHWLGWLQGSILDRIGWEQPDVEGR